MYNGNIRGLQRLTHYSTSLFDLCLKGMRIKFRFWHQDNHSIELKGNCDLTRSWNTYIITRLKQELSGNRSIINTPVLEAILVKEVTLK